jgi:hypothetical protein
MGDDILHEDKFNKELDGLEIDLVDKSYKLHFIENKEKAQEFGLRYKTDFILIDKNTNKIKAFIEAKRIYDTQPTTDALLASFTKILFNILKLKAEKLEEPFYIIFLLYNLTSKTEPKVLPDAFQLMNEFLKDLKENYSWNTSLEKLTVFDDICFDFKEKLEKEKDKESIECLKKELCNCLKEEMKKEVKERLKKIFKNS